MSIPEDFPIKTEVVASGDFEGFPWVAARAPLYGAVNGYVRLPDGHPWLEWLAEGKYVENSVPWGELTFQQGNWVGFDSMHSGQYWPGQSEFSSYGPYEGDTLMTAEMVVGWTAQLAQEAHAFTSSGTPNN